MAKIFSTICGLLVCSLVHAAVPRPQVEAVTTDHVDFAPGGVIHIEGSSGELNIEGWDEPRVEITVTRLVYPDHDTPALRDQVSHELDGMKITAAKKNEKDLTITAPHSRRGVKVDYRIRVPRASSLVIHHGTGDVVVHDVAGDIDAGIKYGDLLLQLPQKDSYAFDAYCREGGIESDFAATHGHAHWFGAKLNQPEVAGAHKIHLHVGIGGINIQQMIPPPGYPA